MSGAAADSAARRARALGALYGPGLDGMTAKITIQKQADGRNVDFDLYLHLAWFEGRLDFIDITCGGEFDYTIRRLIAIICDHVRRELRHDLLDEQALIRDWRGTKDAVNSFEPQGVCPQLPGGYLDKLVASPLDAVARWIKMRTLREGGHA